MTARGWNPRAAMRIACMAGWLIACVIAYYLASPAHLIGRRNPVPPVFLAGLAFIAGIEIEVRGQVPRRAMVLANHISWMDIPVLAATARAAFVAHDGLQGHPALKKLCEMNDTVFIARSQRQTVGAQVQQLRDALDECHVLTLFPEGTTGPGGCLLPIKSSLLSAIDPPPQDDEGPVPIVPVFLDYEDAADVAWGDQPGPENFLSILSRREPVRVAVHFLPALAGAELAGRKAMAAALTARLQSALDRSALSSGARLA